MASTSVGDDKLEDEKIVDASALNQLMHSIGRLKFTLRSLGNMNLQVAVLPSEDTESDLTLDCDQSMHSNAILENAISETFAHRSDQVNDRQCKSTSPLEELELVHEKLFKELQKIRLKYKTAFAEKSAKSISIS